MIALEERNKIIKEIVAPALKNIGLKKLGNNFIRTFDRFTMVFSVTNSSWNTKNWVSFDFYIGILFHVANEIMDRTLKNPSSSSCHFQINCIQLNNSNRSFQIQPETDIEEIRQYVSETITDYVIPFFNKCSKMENWVDLQSKYISNGWDIRPFIGLTFIEKGDIDTGTKLMETINPTYIESFRKQLLDHRDFLIYKNKK